MRAALYLRRSTDKQETSIEDQREEVTKLASAKGYVIVAEYVDDGISGDATEKRLGFKWMMADAAAKRFAVVLCWDQDRFGRFDPLEAGYWIKPMRDAGVVLETVAQGRIDWNDFAGRLLYTVVQEAKHAYLRDLARNTNRGCRARFEAGLWIHGTPPFGYRVGDEEKLVFGPPEEIVAVRRVFALRMQGVGYRSICLIMQREGHASMGGRQWEVNHVRYILSRETYRGHMIASRFQRAKYEAMYPQEKRIVGSHPAIIDEETWQATRPERFRKGKPHRRKGEYHAAFAGLLRCGFCGGTMYAFQYKGEVGYVCSNYHRGRGCVFARVMDRQFREQVAGVLAGELKRFDGAELRKYLTEKLATSQRAASPERLSALDRKIQTATERMLLVPESALPAAQRKIAELNLERLQLATAAKPVATVTVKAALAELQALPRLLCSGSAQHVRPLIGELVDHVRCDFVKTFQGPQRARHAFAGGEVFFADGSSKECSQGPPATLLWKAVAAVLAGDRRSVRFAV